MEKTLQEIIGRDKNFFSETQRGIDVITADCSLSYSHFGHLVLLGPKTTRVSHYKVFGPRLAKMCRGNESFGPAPAITEGETGLSG